MQYKHPCKKIFSHTQNTIYEPLPTKYFEREVTMWKIVAVICMLEWPDYTMLSELECTQFEDASNTSYVNLEQCEVVAQQRAEETLAKFKEARIEVE